MSRPDRDERVDPAAFKTAFRDHPAGVAVLTADAGQGPVGLTATSVFSASVDPPVLAFSISDMSSSTPSIAAADTLVVHLLAAGDVDLAVLCSTSGIDRFADRRLWDRLPTGEPFFPSASRWLRVRPLTRMTVGTATIISALALQAGGSEGVLHGEPLVYHDRHWHRLGETSRLQH